MKSQKYLQ